MSHTPICFCFSMHPATVWHFWPSCVTKRIIWMNNEALLVWRVLERARQDMTYMQHVCMHMGEIIRTNTHELPVHMCLEKHARSAPDAEQWLFSVFCLALLKCHIHGAKSKLRWVKYRPFCPNSTCPDIVHPFLSPVGRHLHPPSLSMQPILYSHYAFQSSRFISQKTSRNMYT